LYRPSKSAPRRLIAGNWIKIQSFPPSLVPSLLKSSDQRNCESRAANAPKWNSSHSRQSPPKLSFVIGTDAPPRAETSVRKSLSETCEVKVYGETVSFGSSLKRSHFWTSSLSRTWNVCCGWTRETIFAISNGGPNR
jgi:hypothetical protein